MTLIPGMARTHGRYFRVAAAAQGHCWQDNRGLSAVIQFHTAIMRRARPLFVGSYPGVFMEGASRVEDLPPGELCTQGGIYQVIHRAHRVPHKALVRKGDRFPQCKGCGAAVRFRLIKHVEGPPPVRAKRVRKKGAGR